MNELLWLSLAFVFGLVANRLKIPIFVGYLVAGFLVASLGQNVTPMVDKLGHLGVILLLFTVGLHLRLRSVFSAPVLVGGSVHLLFSALLFLVTMPLLGWSMTQSAFLGLVLAFSSTVLAAKDLEVRNEMGAYHGRVAIGILLLQDIAAIGVLIYLDQNHAFGSSWLLIAAAIPVALLIRPLLVRLVASVHDNDLMLVMSILLALGSAALTEWAHLGGEVGALFGGALLADHPRAHEMRRRLWDLKEFFLVAFFFMVGVRSFPPEGTWTTVLAISGMVLLVLPLKAGMFFALLTMLGLRARTAFLTGAALTSYSEFTLLAGMMALNAGLITAIQFSVLTVVTAISFAINLPLNDLVNRIYYRYESSLMRLQRKTPHHPDQQTTHFGRATHLIFGMGRTGRAAYDYLVENGYRPLGLDVDPVKIQRNLESKRRVVYGDVQDPSFWETSELSGLKGIVVAVPSFDARLEAVKRISGQTELSTFALNDEEMIILKEAGPVNVSHILTDAGIRIAQSLTD